MKKIYSILLTATMLLVGTNVWGGVVDVTFQTSTGEKVVSYDNLTDALKGAVNKTDNGALTPSVVNVKLNDNTTLDGSSFWMSSSNGNLENNKVVVDLNGHNVDVTSSPRLYVTYLEITGEGTMTYNGTPSVMFWLYGYTEEGYNRITTLVIGKDVTINSNTADYSVAIISAQSSDATNKKKAFGVHVDIYGTVFGTIYINGNVQAKNEEQPHINIHEGASVTTSSTTAAIYAAGYGIWNIEGTLNGGSGIYAKAGEITLDGAEINATGAYAEPTAWGNGYNLTGDAIIFDSHASYAQDGMTLNITGDTKVTSENGYAVREVVTNGEDKLPDFVIESGTFQGADDKGAILTTDAEKNKLQIEGTISGGNFINEPNITDYLSSIEGTIVAVQDENGNTIYVVENIDPEEKSTDLADATAEQKVILSSASENVIELTADKQVAYLALTGKDKVVVNEGVTFTVGNVAIGEDGQIEVKAGGKLIVEGNNGIVANNKENIIIETSEEKASSFMLNPAVTSNRNPKGTFNLISKAYTISEGNYVWQRFGIPTFDGNVTMTWDGTATWIKKADTQTETYTNVLSNATSGNETFTDLVPFASYTMNSDHAAPGAVYTFIGNLMGNQDAELNMIKGASGWNYFANSYTAPIDIYAMLQTLKANYGDNVSVTVYVYQKAGNTWDVINLADMELAALGISEAPQTVINPMQAFILYLYNGTEAQAKINYNDDVFAPATTAAAPRRVVATNVNNAIRFTVANSLYTDNATIIEGANFSDNFDNGYDAQKYMNEANFNLYAVTAEGEMATVATNDIEGTRLAFNAAQAGNYTLTFNTNAANYALKDNATNAVINIEDGATYSFNAEAGVNEARFTVIGRADAPTALENTNATVKRAGIYTLTGQYLGETSMFNTLPQGVYVVDGKKVVR